LVVAVAGREKGGGWLLTAGKDGEKPAITKRCEGDNRPEVARGTQRRWFPLWLSFVGEMNEMYMVDGGSRLAREEGNRNWPEIEVAGKPARSRRSCEMVTAAWGLALVIEQKPTEGAGEGGPFTVVVVMFADEVGLGCTGDGWWPVCISRRTRRNMWWCSWWLRLNKRREMAGDCLAAAGEQNARRVIGFGAVTRRRRRSKCLSAERKKKE
jgi:hypothetical protein